MHTFQVLFILGLLDIYLSFIKSKNLHYNYSLLNIKGWKQTTLRISGITKKLRKLKPLWLSMDWWRKLEKSFSIEKENQLMPK